MKQVPNNIKIILPYFIIIMIDAMSVGMLTPILANLVVKPQGLLLHLSSSHRHQLFSVVLALGPFCFMLGAPIFGHLSDIFGRKRVLLCCITGTLVSFVCYWLAFHYHLLSLLIIGRIIDGATSGSQGVAQAALVDVSDAKYKASNIAFFATAMTFGMVLGPFIGAVFSDSTVVSWFNNSTPFALSIILNALSILLFFKTMRETKKQRSTFTHLTHNLKGLLQQRTVLLLLISFFFFEVSWSLFFANANLILIKQFQMAKHILGLFSLYIGAIQIIALAVITPLLVKRFSNNSIIIISQAIMGLSLLGLFLPLYISYWFFSAIVAIAVGCIYACIIAKLSNQINNQQQGFLLGLSDGVLAMAFTVSGLLSGTMSYLNISLPNWLCFISISLSLILFFIVYQHTKTAKHNIL